VAEEEVLSEKWHPHHLPCHSEYFTYSQNRLIFTLKGCLVSFDYYLPIECYIFKLDFFKLSITVAFKLF